jgi:hypothetical protein
MTKTDLPYNTAGSGGDLRSAGTCWHLLALLFWQDPLRPDLVFVITFRKLFPGPQIGLEGRVSPSSTICAKNQALNLVIEKVTVILLRKYPS